MVWGSCVVLISSDGLILHTCVECVWTQWQDKEELGARPNRSYQTRNRLLARDQNSEHDIAYPSFYVGIRIGPACCASGSWIRGGILLAWSSASCGAITHRVDSYSVSVLFQNNSGLKWWCTGVYGPQEDMHKIQLLEELREVRAACAGPWMIAGDFNLIYSAADKNNSNLDRAMMGQFMRVINDLELREVDLLRRRFTWSNERATPTLVCLDRVFCTATWEEAFPNHLLQSTAAGTSDHFPLVLNLHGNGVGKCRFHFESFWPKLPDLAEMVIQAWNSIPESAATYPLDRLASKFIATSRTLQSWSQWTVGNVAAQVEQEREILLHLEVAQETRVLT